VWISSATDLTAFECDEIFWFIKRKERTENRANIYIMTMISRIPRQIVAFAVDKSVNSATVQRMADVTPTAKFYYTDGSPVYCDVVFGGRHKRNVNDKKDTHTIESTNADIRHYIPGLARRKRCFYRSAETLKAVLGVYIDAYNKFGEAKSNYRQIFPNAKSFPFSTLDFI
jgi:IS1 family transposase